MSAWSASVSPQKPEMKSDDNATWGRTANRRPPPRTAHSRGVRACVTWDPARAPSPTFADAMDEFQVRFARVPAAHALQYGRGAGLRWQVNALLGRVRGSAMGPSAGGGWAWHQGFLQGRQPAPTLQMLSRSFINASSSSGKSLGCGEVNRMRTSGTAVETLFSMRTTRKRVTRR